jgi:2-polyprenyl-6-methoxyphenol hydroxylase-like FAD-dependent oxidoreductase
MGPMIWRLPVVPHHKKNHSLTTMSATDDQNAAITTPERRNNSGILTADAGRPAGWGWGSAIRSLVANNTPTTPTASPSGAIIATTATAATTEPVATTEAGHFTESPSMTSLVADSADAEKRRKTRRNDDDDDDDDDSTDTFRMIIDDIVEEIQEKKAKLEGLVRDESDMTKTPLKSNVTPTSHRQGQMDEAM